MAKIEIFISWHGPRGHALAETLKDWLPQIANDFDPWFSSDIQKGAPWRKEISGRLAKAKAGVIILTPSALTSPWLLFEAGAIAKDPEKPYACTLLVGLEWKDVSDPLAQFQHTTVTKEDVLRLLNDLNAALETDRRTDAQIKKAFEKWWPDLESAVKELPPDEEAKNPHRDQGELLAELIDLARLNTAQVENVRTEIIKRLESLQNLREFERRTVFHIQPDGILTTLDGTRKEHMEFLQTVPLLIIDDLGMRKLPLTAAEELLEIIMRRYERASTMLTSNRPVEDWGKLLGDAAAVTAMLDRLLHHGHLLKCGPRSWRTKLDTPEQ